jgi:hypothetical protein
MAEAALTLRTFHLQSDQLVELPQLPNWFGSLGAGSSAARLAGGAAAMDQ